MEGFILPAPSGSESPTSAAKAMGNTLVTLVGALLLCGAHLHRQSSKKEGARCSHHSQCSSDCCLINFDLGGAFCAPRARLTMLCLPQTKGALNIICPCRRVLSCSSQDPNCPRRCHWI
ncbi:colipase-like protein 2 [Sorex araneus]|uniref:colipase-like protein 2 n=1 Tax=Sorex araneus TaxID=42254 RepID=UPI002433435A|nr:colipase-like protein 2 [Sorex araneus]